MSYTITIADNVRSTDWRQDSVSWEDFVSRCRNVVRTNETVSEFASMPKDKRLKAKDVGGYVAGVFDGTRRVKEAIKRRCMLTLDLDFPRADFWECFKRSYTFTALLHSTHSHTPSMPRYRLIIPLSRELDKDEYQAIARFIAAKVDPGAFDPSTFEPNRLMFWPSVASDGEYICETQDGEILNPDSIFENNKYLNDRNYWPETLIEEAQKLHRDKVEDPQVKSGVIGAFCRAFTISEAIRTFLPEIYIQSGHNRYTYTKGTTSSGLIVYEDDAFAYSHHGTDPAFGKLLNSFDLVRIHLFGAHDDNVKPGTPINKLPSYVEMLAYAVLNPKVVKQIGIDSTSIKPSEKEEDTEWLSKMEVKKSGEYANSAENYHLIMNNDPKIKGVFALNEFDKRIYILRSTPWRDIESPVCMEDVDLSGLRSYIERTYGISSAPKIDDAVSLDALNNSFHPIKDYLNGLQWDGVKRVDDLLIDFFGATDNIYTRACIRKSLCAAVARIFNPGTKFDMVLILCGQQGTYKSTFFRKLGKAWFSDTLTTVQGKEAYEQLQGAWLIEIGELSALNKSEIEAIKQFITKSEDYFRPAYGRVTTLYKRQCVFFGTTNDVHFLRDSTGNRRFNPIDVNHSKAVASVAEDLTDDIVDQIWAEVVTLYRAGEKLYLNKEELSYAVAKQAEHFDYDDRMGLVREYLDMPLPSEWYNMELSSRKFWIASNDGTTTGPKRDYVSVIEIWCECLGFEPSSLAKRSSREINDIMRAMPGWELNGTKQLPLYGRQRIYVRKPD